MKKIILFLFSVLLLSACDKSPIEKPENLVAQKQMVEMLIDLHLAEATFNNRRYDDESLKNSSSVNFYYSILDKYEVADSVFEKSFVFYASNPKNFEKIYKEVTNRLSEIEQEYSGRKNQPLEFDDGEQK